MAKKLKVYSTRIGFHDAVVAAPSQKAALAAWDVREDLFAQKAAETTDDPEAVKAATARPGVVLRRAAGSDRPFSEAPDAPVIPRSKKPAKAEAAPRERPAKPPPDRRALDATEKALGDLAADETRTADDIARRRRDLDAEEREQARVFATRRRNLERDRDRARRAYERDGG